MRWTLALPLILLLPVSGTADGRRSSYRVIEPTAAWGRVEGTCRIGRAVDVPTIRMACGEHAGKRSSPRIVYDARSRGLANCLVWIEDISAGKRWPLAMDVEDRTAFAATTSDGYVPHVQWVRTGTQLGWLNRSKAEDNVHLYRAGATQANFMIPPGASRRDLGDLYLDKRGVYAALSDCWLGVSAYVLAFEHPYVARPTSRSGRYELTDVPPGTYTLVCWHEGMRHDEERVDGRIVRYRSGPPVEVRKKVTVPAKGTVTVDFVVPAPD